MTSAFGITQPLPGARFDGAARAGADANDARPVVAAAGASSRPLPEEVIAE